MNKSGTIILLVSLCILYSATVVIAGPYCYEEAARMYSVNEDVLYSIAAVESRHDPYAININLKGRSYELHPRSYRDAVKAVKYLQIKGYDYDLGICQINRRNIKHYRINPVALLDPCYNLRWSAYILSEKIRKYGYGWKAIAMYNGADSYAWKVYYALGKINRDYEKNGYGHDAR